jgi:pimeloyl-ACP methyl ester carboxylesterase
MDARERVVNTTDGGRLAVTRWQAEGPTVVLLHAGVTDQRSWTAVAGALAHEQVDIVAYDRRGFGASPAAETTSAFTHVADLMEVLDQVVLVGNSMGGALALDAALLHPDRVTGVVLIGAAVSGMTDDDTPFDWRPDTATTPHRQSRRHIPQHRRSTSCSRPPLARRSGKHRGKGRRWSPNTFLRDEPRHHRRGRDRSHR